MVEWKVSFGELGENATPWLTLRNMLEDLLLVGASVLISFKHHGQVFSFLFRNCTKEIHRGIIWSVEFWNVLFLSLGNSLNSFQLPSRA